MMNPLFKWCKGYSAITKNNCIRYKLLVNCAAADNENGDEKQRTSILSVRALK